MSERHRFRPEIVAGLEARVVLSGGAVITPATIGRLDIAHVNATHAVVSNVNQVFDSFTADYLQAEGAYFANSTPQAEHVLRGFVRQRVALLSAQLTRIFAHVPGSLDLLQTSSSGGPVVLQNFLRTRINGGSARSLLVALDGRNGNGGAIPPPGATGTTATLYTDQAITAIETARAVTVNCVGFSYGRAFQHKNK
jgi:hypothetical protein